MPSIRFVSAEDWVCVVFPSRSREREFQRPGTLVFDIRVPLILDSAILCAPGGTACGRKKTETWTRNTEVDWLEPPNPPIRTPESLSHFPMYFLPQDTAQAHMVGSTTQDVGLIR